MNNRTFETLLAMQMATCENVLTEKADEYASDTDRLHNFKVAARMQGITPIQALAGMMAKHTVSVYDLCKMDEDDFVMAVWDEKLTDHINYLILLKAAVHETTRGKEQKEDDTPLPFSGLTSESTSREDSK